jgi:hypothetical protein
VPTASCFDGDGYALVIFMSPSGLCLGTVVVPAEWSMEVGGYPKRTAGEIAAWWREGPVEGSRLDPSRPRG